MVLASTGSSIQSLLERLDPDQLFGLMCTSVSVGAAAAVLIVWSVSGSWRRVSQVKLRTQFVTSLIEQGHSRDEILEMTRLTFQSPRRSCRTRRAERRHARAMAKSGRHQKPVYEKPILQKPIPPQAVAKV